MANNDSTASTGSPEAAPTTPETACVDLPIHSTPTVHKQSANIPFTSGHVIRDETLIALGNEMIGYVVGPMPAKFFLDLLPPSPRKRPSFRKKPFVDLAKYKLEPQLYKPFIKAMAAFCPDLTGIDTSGKEMKIFSGKTIKPDITYYNSSCSQKSGVGRAELMVEAKINEGDDPFDDEGTLLRNNDRSRQTLGQVTSYATAHLAAQFRTHVFSVLLFSRSARLMRWDRAGLIVSERISLDNSVLTQFFWRFNSANAKDRGHDPTVTPYTFTKDLTKEFLFDQLQFAADSDDVKVEDINFFEVLLPRENSRYVIGKATYLGVASLASRATRSFKAWCLKTRKPVFLKDTWRILSGSQRPEHDIYKKLATAKVQRIATVLDYSDIKDHRTVTGRYAEESWVCESNLKPFRTLQHYRLVLQEIGRSLTSFKDIREVLAAMRDAIQAHRESFYNGRVLHRDISAGNVIIYGDGGLLIDWDMSKDLDWTSDDKNISRTGTWAFQSLRLSQLPEGNDVQVVHSRLDDLESFYHVLFWISLQHARHGFTSAELYDHLTRLFDHALIVDNKAYSNPTKDSHMTSTRTIEKAKFKNPPLLELLLEISINFRPLYISPPTSAQKKTKSQAKKARRAGESYQTALENYKEDINFLNSKEDSNWMELCFEEALQCPDDEWGLTGFISNEKAPPVADPKIKRMYSDMSTSRGWNSQGGNFAPSDQIAEVDENQAADEFSDENEEEEENEESDQPPRTRRRLD